MPRPHRIIGADLTYHIYARGNNGEAIFRDDADRVRYLATLADARSKYECHVFAYVLMTTHVHMIIQTAKPSISKVMWHVHGNHATFFNRKYHRYGHLFASRFRSRTIQTNEYLIQCSAYIHLNPVSAGLVQRPEDHEWSSYRAYITEGAIDPIVEPSTVLDLLATSRHRAIHEYSAFVAGRRSPGQRRAPLPPMLPAPARGGPIGAVREPTSESS